MRLPGLPARWPQTPRSPPLREHFPSSMKGRPIRGLNYEASPDCPWPAGHGRIGLRGLLHLLLGSLPRMRVIRVLRVILVALAVAGLPIAEGVGIGSTEVTVSQPPAQSDHDCCCEKAPTAKCFSIFAVIAASTMLALADDSAEPWSASSALRPFSSAPPVPPPRV